MLHDVVDQILEKLPEKFKNELNERCWVTRARQGSGFPYCVVNYITGDDLGFLGSHDPASNTFFQVDVVGSYGKKTRELAKAIFDLVARIEGDFDESLIHEINSQSPPRPNRFLAQDGGDENLFVYSRDFAGSFEHKEKED